MRTLCSEVNSCMSEVLYPSKMPCALGDVFGWSANSIEVSQGSYKRIILLFLSPLTQDILQRADLL